MNKFIETWCDALLSGKYTQTKHCLKDNKGFCCLGVAADIKYNSEWGIDSTNNYYTPNKEYESLSLTTLSDIGITEEQQDVLINLNDDKGYSFSEIAEVLKSNFSSINENNEDD